MNFMDEIEKRFSCRAYNGAEIDLYRVAALYQETERSNAEAGTHFQLWGPREDGSAITTKTSMFDGTVPAYAALVATDDELGKEKVGYYGEHLVLLATNMGLNTCWVASTYERETTRVELAEGEVLHDVILMGYAPDPYPEKQAATRAKIRARNKALEDLYVGPTPLAEAPEWVREGVRAISLAPSAVNCQPVQIVQDEAGTVRACIRTDQEHRGHEFTDLGIAKQHFLQAAEANGVKGTWEWGDGAVFSVQE